MDGRNNPLPIRSYQMMIRAINEPNRVGCKEKFKARIRFELDIFEFDSKLENLNISGWIKVRVRIRLERFEHVREPLLEKCSNLFI